MKLTKLLLEYPGAFTPAPDDEVERNKQDQEKRRDPNYIVQQYIKNGSKGDLDLTEINEDNQPETLYLKLTSLPDNLHVDGSLYLSLAVNLQYLPKNLKVKDDLFIEDSGIKELPADLEVGGGLWAAYSELEHIPDNFTVSKSLLVSGSKITYLPKGLRVGESIRASSCNLKYLSDDIRTTNLFIYNTHVEEIPNSLMVENFDCHNTPLAKKYTEKQIRDMIFSKGGMVDIIKNI